MAGILERLKAATGRLNVSEANDIAYEAGLHGEEYALMVKALRGELDAVGAAIALVERLLPGWMLKLGKPPVEGWTAQLIGPTFSLSFSNEWDGEQVPQDPAIAILTAIFTSLTAKEEQS